MTFYYLSVVVITGREVDLNKSILTNVCFHISFRDKEIEKKLADLPIPRVYNRREEVFCTKKGYSDIMSIYIYI